jgi:hypothetical protein
LSPTLSKLQAITTPRDWLSIFVGTCVTDFVFLWIYYFINFIYCVYFTSVA